MKVPKRYLKKEPGVFKVVGLLFKPTVTSVDTEQTTSLHFKIGDWEEPINFVPYFQTSESNAPKVH